MILKHSLFCSDVSKQELNIYLSGSTADTEKILLLDKAPANPYNIYCVILSDRKAIMEIIVSKLYINM